MNSHVLRAIFKRNFVSYFSNPTGYVFICVFVLLNSIAAFWPAEFFNSNLANLDQLNRWLPYIMLIFIPAITMSVWAEERKEGTDELLLTIPAADLDVVLGKYLAAVAIFSVALAFSMLSTLWMLLWLGSPDMGLFLATYVGYWFVGIAMLAVGMVASFLTGNLTVGFILGVVFNAPLAFSAAVELIVKSPGLAQAVKRWSVAEQFRDFERGVLSISSISYFVLIAVVMLYLSVALIGRRHWLGGRDGRSMLGHYLVRVLCLVAILVGVNYFFSNHDFVRADITSERLTSLSPDTRRLIRDLDTQHQVVIEAYVSPRVPAEYVQKRLNLLSTLDELNALGSEKIRVVTHEIENFSQEAARAEEKYNIKPQTVFSRSRGARTEEDIFMGVAFLCGRDNVIVPFVDKGIPVEYELVRSICTVAQPDRMKVGVVRTDASLLSSFSMQTMQQTDESMIIQELRKQYEVVEVDATSPITGDYDVLLAVQPSTLGPSQLQNFIAAVKRGQPTAIFEDPYPFPGFWPNVVGTSQPRRRPQMNPFMGNMGNQPPPPKGNIGELWQTLGVAMAGDEVIWQNYNPYPKGQAFITPEWVFVEEGADNITDDEVTPFNKEANISSNLQQLLFIYPGSFRKLNTSELDFTELINTGSQTGTISHANIQMAMQRSRMGTPMAALLSLFREATGENYTLAAHIQGELLEDDMDFSLDEADDDRDDDGDDDGADGNDEEDGEGEDKEEDAGDDDKQPGINVVLVSDIDCLASAFFFVRAQGEEEEAEIAWDFHNVTLVLNALDVLAGDDRFVEIRKRRRIHRTLVNLERRTEEARDEATSKRDEFNNSFESERQKAQTQFDEKIKKIQDEQIPLRQRQIREEMVRRDEQRKLDVRIAALEDDRDRELKSIERDLALDVRGVQDQYKWAAVCVPPILPLLLGFFVFFHRRQGEREGVAESRLR